MDTLSYVLYKNPVITYSIGAVKYAADCTVSAIGINSGGVSKTLTKKELWKMLEINRNYIRLAGVIGATAMILGAYGAHTINPNKEISEHTKRVFDTANRYHFFHSLALIAVPFCKYPHLTGITMISGITLFCGTCYYECLTGNSSFKRLTPVGGSLLILGWLSMIL